MTQLQSDIMTTTETTTTETRAQRQCLPGRDRRERVASVVLMFLMAVGSYQAVYRTQMANWPIWLTTLTLLAAGCAVVFAYAVWYRRRTPAPAHADGA